MGALVLFDSCFDDLKDGVGFDNLSNGSNIEFKLNGDFFGDSEPTIKYAGMDLHITKNNVDEVLVDNFKRIFSSNVFSSEFSNYGGIKPPQSIINLIIEIGNCNYKNHKSNGPSEDLGDVILTNFKEFLHNKVGKIITETEKPQLYPSGTGINLSKRGDLIGINFNYESQSFYWAIYIDQVGDGEHKVLTVKPNTSNDTRDLTVDTVSEGDIARVHGTIDQSFKPDHKISSEEELLETYIVSY